MAGVAGTLPFVPSAAPPPRSGECGAALSIGGPIGRYMTSHEIANTVLFLCPDLASAITGAQYVDGARTAAGGAVTQALPEPRVNPRDDGHLNIPRPSHLPTPRCRGSRASLFSSGVFADHLAGG